MSEDYGRGNTNPAAVEQMVLRDIHDLLYSMGKDITGYGLPEINDIGESCNGVLAEIRGELNVLVDQDHLDTYTSLNDEQRAGFDEIIHHITLSPSDDISLPLKFKRKQSPIRLSLAMTINKSQGQTIPNVGIYLLEPGFSHGQLYIVLSRGVSKQATKILVKPKKEKKEVVPIGKSIRNIVYKDVLDS
uniref:ATP-dependent DNA helicase n=1 Tax=Oryza punctata TaxID=4537 RepID=A0A0E0JZT3_ORYPU